jgi:nitroreductase
MSDRVEVIKTRRNIKEFTEQSVSQSQIETLLELATWAPNHRNTVSLGYYHSRITTLGADFTPADFILSA